MGDLSEDEIIRKFEEASKKMKTVCDELYHILDSIGYVSSDPEEIWPTMYSESVARRIEKYCREISGGADFGVDLARSTILRIEEIELNRELGRYSGDIVNDSFRGESGQIDYYQQKKAIVRTINQRLRGSDFAICHPETWQPCLLLCVNSRDKNGRYTLEDRKTKKRIGSYKSISDLLPLHLIFDVPRVEGFLKEK